jgi:NAD(P)H-hydrate epimerase
VTLGEPLYTAAEMRSAEETYPGPTLELMERAGQAVADSVLRNYPTAQRVSVWCGGGNNGGDGLVVARRLHEAGREVSIRLLAEPARLQGDSAENLRRAQKLGVPFGDGAGPADVVVDALFGTGFTGAPRREAAEAIAMINDSAAPVVAIDVPSGIDASTGEVSGEAVDAALTVTFHGRKVGLSVAPGRFRAGQVEVAGIGLVHDETRHRRVGPELLGLVPRRGPGDNKYSAGSVLVIGGSTGLTGAPCLSAESALRAGAGVVVACVPATLNLVFEQRLLEVMTHPCADDGEGRLDPSAADEILSRAERAGAVALGPGLGRTEGTRELVRMLLERLDLPVVLDADGLWAIAGELGWVFARQAPTVLTPHAGELGRLLGWESSQVAARRLHAATAGADDAGATVLLKGIDTLVASPGHGGLVADLGNAGLATAGSGDVLTGIVVAFLAKGMEPKLAAAAAAAAQGIAAGRAAAERGFAGMIASDVTGVLSSVLSTVSKGEHA